MRRLFIELALILCFLPLIAAASALEATFIDEKGKPVADAVISAFPLENQTMPTLASNSAELEQINKEFKPHVTVIQRGGQVIFPNRDSVAHHVYSFAETKKFELPLYSGVPEPITFEKNGIVTLGCNIHDWMKAYIVVVDTPFFAKSPANGKISISDLPAGLWRLEVWHPRLKGEVLKRELKIAAEAVSSESFTLSLRREWKKSRGPAGEGLGY